MAEAIDSKKMISMINAFAVTTGEFLNHFCAKAHKRISAVNRQMERLEALTALLEYKVNSLPTDFTPPPPRAEARPAGDNSAVTEATPEVVEPPKPVIDEEYKPYIRMLNIGIPRQHVKNKMAADGKNPDKIDELVPPPPE